MKLQYIFALIVLLGMQVNLHSQGYDINKSKWITDTSYVKENPERIYKLDLSHMGLKNIPYYLRACKNLEFLILSNNSISAIEEHLGELSHLVIVDLSKNNLSKIDFQVFSSSKNTLQEIYLRENNITEIDISINAFNKLEVLNVGYNKIEHISKEIYLPQLISFYGDGNLISMYPDFLKNSQTIKRINLYQNKIQEVSIYATSRNLQKLNLGDNPLRKLEFENDKIGLKSLIIDWVDMTQLAILNIPKKISQLYLEHCNLSSVPPYVFELKKLRELSLMHNNISTIPESLSQSKHLKKLWIQGNIVGS